MRKARPLVVQTDAAAPLTGSIADVAARLALWGRRAPKGLARVEFVSDFSRQEVVSQLRVMVPQSKSLYEIELPFQQPALVVVHFLQERLRNLTPGIVSITGLATAFSDDCPLADSLRVLNFHRDNLAQFPLCQIWWMTQPFAGAFLRTVPDLASWFMLRLRLTEVIVDKTVEMPFLLGRQSALANPDETRKQSAAYVDRFRKALATSASTSELVHLAFVATSVLGNALLEQEEQELAETLLNEMAPQLRKQGLLGDGAVAFTPKTPTSPPFGFDHFGQAENLRLLGQLCECAGKIDEAEAFYQASLGTVEYSVTPGFDVLGLAFSSLKQFYLRQERYLEAELLCKRWLNRQESMLGPDSFDVLYILDELQEVYVLAGKYDIAEQIYHRMLNTAKKDQVHNQLLEASLLNNMSWLYKQLGRYVEAEALSQRASRMPNAA